MFRNFLKIAWRNTINQKLFSFINIGGLAIGLTICMLIIVYVNHELSFDHFHSKGKRIFGLHANVKVGSNSLRFPNTSFTTGPILKEKEPSIEEFTRIYKPNEGVTIQNPKVVGSLFSESDLLFVDSNFFNFFSFYLLSGDKSNVLSKPFSIVISRKMVKKYFGNRDPIGKTLKIKTDSAFYDFEITGVVENNLSNSSIQYEFLTSNASFHLMSKESFLLNSQTVQPGLFKTYLLLNKQADSSKVQSNLNKFSKEDPDSPDISFFLTNITDIHLKENLATSSSNKYLKVFPLVAILILILALVNFMSLSTARSTLRAKEIGVRKVAGASRFDIIKQFYVESLVFTLPAFLIAYVLCYLCLPLFFNKLGIIIDASFLFSFRVIVTISLLFLLTASLAGSYPSLVLSSYQPIATLKGKMSNKVGGKIVRKTFTVLQFTISIGLITCGIIIYKQLYYFRHTNTGLNRDNVLMVPISNNFGNQYNSFKKDVQSLTGISQVASSKYSMYKGYDMLFSQGKNKSENIAMAMLLVDKNFISLLNIKLKVPSSGELHIAGSNKVIINEVAIKSLGLSESTATTSLINNGTDQYEISGVVKNFNFSSMEYEIKPLCLLIASDTFKWGNTGGCLYAKIKAHTNIPTLINNIQKLHYKYDMENSFTYIFMDDAFDQQYKAEERLAWIFSVFTIITLFLAIIGLFGLSAFNIEQRTKEIGIRKVLGAGVMNITILLSIDFLRLVTLSIVIASPVAWWIMHKWLQNFSFRTDIQLWMFALSGSLSLLIAALTISCHTFRLAISNPINSLRTE